MVSTRILVTQPRRVSCISVAKRVAYERDEMLGTSVGYAIRHESQQSNLFDEGWWSWIVHIMDLPHL